MILWVAFGVFSSQKVHAEGFLVSPHLFFKKEQPVLSWLPSVLNSLKVEDQKEEWVDFRFSDGTKRSIQAQLHTVELPLKCGWGDQFYYSVRTQAGLRTLDRTPNQRIENLPCAGSSSSLRIAFLSDTQLHADKSEKIGNRISDFHPNLILHGGDHVENGGEYSQWIRYFKSMQNAYQHSLLMGAVGNHEYYTEPGIKNFEQFFQYSSSEAYFSVNIGSLKVMVLNSNFKQDPTLLQKEKLWLDLQLASHDSKWTIVFFHHPPFSSGIMGSLIAPGAEWITMKKEFVPLFERYHVDLVLAGHVHLFEHRVVNRVHYLNAGPAGGRFWSKGIPAGYINDPFSEDLAMRPGERTWTEIVMDQDRMKVVTKNIRGKTMERFKITH